METGITNLDSWLWHTIRSNAPFDIINLEMGYDAAAKSLVIKTQTMTSELEMEMLFTNTLTLIKLTRDYVRSNDLANSDLRTQLLDNLETVLRRSLSDERSSYSPKIEWAGENDELYEILIQLKQKHNKKGQPYLNNSYEDLASFLKNNFSGFKDTQLSTIQTRMRTLASKREGFPKNINLVWIK